MSFFSTAMIRSSSIRNQMHLPWWKVFSIFSQRLDVARNPP